MKSLFSVIFILSIILPTLVLGQDVGASGPFEKEEITGGFPPDADLRNGGDTIETATEITSLPFYETGWTNNMADDYQEVCVVGWNTSPDVVYSYTPSTDMFLDLDMCGTGFNANIFVIEDTYTPGEVYACSNGYYFGDPYCDNGIPRMLNLPLFAGHTYYFIIDGYMNSFGSYYVNFREVVPCELTIPADAILEGEPPLANNEFDNYNSGCNVDPPIHQPINYYNGDSHCVEIAGVTGYARWYNGGIRDTDWYIVTALEYEMSASVISETAFSLFVGGLNCPFWSDSREDMDACTQNTITWDTVPGQQYTVLVAPRGTSNWNNELTEMDYLLEVCGHEGDTIAVESTTWDALKASFR